MKMLWNACGIPIINIQNKFALKVVRDSNYLYIIYKYALGIVRDSNKNAVDIYWGRRSQKHLSGRQSVYLHMIRTEAYQIIDHSGMTDSGAVCLLITLEYLMLRLARPLLGILFWDRPCPPESVKNTYT